AVALMSTNNIEFLGVYFARAKLGLVCVPINLFWRHKELGYVLSHAGAVAAVVESELIEQLRTGLDDAPALENIIVIGGSAPSEIAGRPARALSKLIEGASME